MSYLKAMIQFTEEFEQKYGRSPVLAELGCEYCKLELGYSTYNAIALMTNATCQRHGGVKAEEGQERARTIAIIRNIARQNRSDV